MIIEYLLFSQNYQQTEKRELQSKLDSLNQNTQKKAPIEVKTMFNQKGDYIKDVFEMYNKEMSRKVKRTNKVAKDYGDITAELEQALKENKSAFNEEIQRLDDENKHLKAQLNMYLPTEKLFNVE